MGIETILSLVFIIIPSMSHFWSWEQLLYLSFSFLISNLFTFRFALSTCSKVFIHEFPSFASLSDLSDPSPKWAQWVFIEVQNEQERDSSPAELF